MCKRKALFLGSLSAILFQGINAASAHPGDGSEPREPIFEMGETSLAAGYSQPLVRAPAITTVISAQTIEKMGARTVADVLKSVPGLHVSVARGVNEVFVMRGFFDEMDSYVLLLVNGIPLNNIVNGGRPQAWKMPVHDVARIEIMRGPGSALYGADAAAGVINIVTKSASELRGLSLGTYFGSYQTQGVWAQGGGEWNGIQGSFSFEASATEGYRKIIKADDQSRIDRLLGTHASLAPGPINTQRDDINARIELDGERWTFRASYQGFLDVGTGTGITLTLDPDGHFNSEVTSADFTYDFAKGGSWDISTQVSYLGTKGEAFLNPFPPGAFGGLFKDGIHNDIYFLVDEVRGGITALYGGLPHHRFRFGLGGSYAWLHDIRERRNFIFGTNNLPMPTPYSDVIDLGQAPFLLDHERGLLYGFAQDEWWLLPEWILTYGARIDHYSDFGTTFNPRAALVWNPDANFTAKAMYGRAFRAPNFTELDGNNLLAVSGNPNLDPETLDMLELSLSKKWTPRFRTNLALYGYQLNDAIRGGTAAGTSKAPLSKIQKQNRTGRRGTGLELDFAYRVNDRLELEGSYANYNSHTSWADDPSRVAPSHQLYAAMNYRLPDAWSLYSYVRWVGERKKGQFLSGPLNTDSYTLAGVSLLRTQTPGWSFSITVDNLFDARAAEPADIAALPDGIPSPGRNIWAQVRWTSR